MPLSGKLYLVDRATAAVRPLPSTAGSPIDPRFSPDGTMLACVRDNEIFVVDTKNGTKETVTERQLTHGATATITHGLAEFVAQEEMARMHGFWWSPDSRMIVYEEANTADVEELSIADPSHPERPAQLWRTPVPEKITPRCGWESFRQPAAKRSGWIGIGLNFPIWPA